MQSFSLGAGLAALAFWGFIASVVVAGIWYDIRKREAQQETVRRIIESGQHIDEKLMDKLMNLGGDKGDRLDRTFKITALILLPTAVGLAIFGMILGTQFPESQLPLVGAGVLAGCVGLGFLAAANIAKRWYVSDDQSTGNHL